jgi:cation diffusion facilitator family transporter
VEPEEKSRAYYGYLEAAVSIIVNSGIAAVKFAIGLYINSIALITDGIHSFSDIATSVIVIYGFKSSEKPPDPEHPFGHGRIEDIASLIISILLVVVGIEFLVSSTRRVFHPEVVQGSFLFFGIVIVTIIVKEALARYSLQLSHAIDSHALKADAWHHRSDALSSVPAAFGVLASVFGVYYVDSLSGIIVSAIIMYVGYVLGKGAASSLLGEAPSEELVSTIRELALEKGVASVHDVDVHDYGTRKVVSLSVIVNPMSVEEAHQVADSVERNIADTLNAVAVVHIEGVKIDESIKKEISGIVEDHHQVISCHAVTIGEKIDFHVVVNKDMNVQEAHELAHHLEEDITQKFGKEVSIHIEPCEENCENCSQD